MAEFDSTAQLEAIRKIIDRAIINKNAAISDVRAINYFVNGDYANDAYNLILMVKELDEHLSDVAGCQNSALPNQWTAHMYRWIA